MGRGLHVGIVGCGVAGLASAVALGWAGHRVTLIERAPKLAPVGAGLLLQPSGQMALRAMGLLEEVIARAEPIEALHAVTHQGRTLVRLAYSRLGPNLTGYGVHRDDLFQVLYRHATLAGVEFKLGCAIEGAEQTDNEIFAVDEKRQRYGPFDVLIGADGARSRLRLTPELGAKIRQFPLQAAWFSGRSDAVRSRLHQVTRGGRQLIGMLPVGESRCSLFCALPRDGKAALERVGVEGLKREIRTLCPQAEGILEQIHSLADLACTNYQLVWLRQWNDRRLICIGDAAHSTTPHLGQGVNLALLDALAVAHELNGNGDDPVAGLARAAAFRREQTMWCWRLSNLLGPVFQNENPLLPAGRDWVLPWLPGLPWVGRMMVGTMAGLHTGIVRRLKLSQT